jgi:eukaryotic-like serine/threonine-protein kinase
MTAPSMSDPGVRAGEVLAGKYQVERVLGAGGMGVVVAAHHIQLDEKVALKFLLPEALGNSEALARFEREARAAVKIKSEHVARVIDVGKLENGAPYMVMEYLEGGDLSGMLEKMGKLPPEQAVDFVIQACDAIAEAHSLGIVHRDLKPSNLFCIRRRDGALAIKVLDFGISKLTAAIGGPGSGSRDMAMTKTTAVVGSPVYMSPEQMQSSKSVDHRTDIWSLGVILYELLTGRLPFNGDTVTELAIRIATEPAPSMATIPPGLPPGLEPVVQRCLEKARERRPQSIAELVDALAPFGTARCRPTVERIHGLLGTAIGATVLSPGNGVPSPMARSGGTVPGWQSDSANKGGGRVVVGIAAGGGILLVAAAVAIVLLVRRGPAQQVSTAASAAAAVTAAASATASTGAVASASASASASAGPADSSAVAPQVVASSSAAPAPTPTPHPAAPAHPVGPSPAPPPSKAHCNPPYYFDAQGNRVFKKECI